MIDTGGFSSSGGASVAEAGAVAYEAVARISFAGMQWRTDIAARAGTVPVP